MPVRIKEPVELLDSKKQGERVPVEPGVYFYQRVNNPFLGSNAMPWLVLKDLGHGMTEDAWQQLQERGAVSGLPETPASKK